MGRVTPVFASVVALLLELLMLRVEEALAHERDRAEQRDRIAAAAAAAAAERDVQRDRRAHDLQAAPRIGDRADLRLVDRRRRRSRARSGP